jgi:hypothetical protein
VRGDVTLGAQGIDRNPLAFPKLLASMVLVGSITFPPLIFTQPVEGSYIVYQGFQMKLRMTDYGVLGDVPYSWWGGIGCEYPANSQIEHLQNGGLWIGALIDTGQEGRAMYVKAVTENDYPPNHTLTLPFSEMTRADSTYPWRHLSTVSGDSGAISESDYICEYTDTARLADIPDHKPLGIKVRQRSMAWASAVREPIIPIEYDIINLGRIELRNVFIGINLISCVSPAEQIEHGGYNHNIAGYWPEISTAFVQNIVDAGSTPIGFTILSLPRPYSALTYSYRWFRGFKWLEESDSTHYDELTGTQFPGDPLIKPDQSPTDLSSVSLRFAFGPVDPWNAGDTLKLYLGIIGGQSLRYGPDNVYDNARAAQTLFQRHFNPPVVVPSPKLRIEYGRRSVTLRWGYNGSGVNPIDTWDDENALVDFYPPDHWRRANPPAGHTRGGRVFEGFRLYRSEDPAGTRASFTLLREWTVRDTVGPRYGYQTGIDTMFVDSNLRVDKAYWYSVTSFGLPDLHVIDYFDRDGRVKKDTLLTPNLESSVLASRKRVILPFSVSHEPGKVLVVPNPYRTDENYTYEFGGYEGRNRSWTEDKRLIKFIHLPEECTIRILTLAGDVVNTLTHNDPVRGEESWNLLSESGRAIASGVYIFSVESRYGKQVGKFVVIR